jgi:hypothetical protein
MSFGRIGSRLPNADHLIRRIVLESLYIGKHIIQNFLNLGGLDILQGKRIKGYCSCQTLWLCPKGCDDDHRSEEG